VAPHVQFVLHVFLSCVRFLSYARTSIVSRTCDRVLSKLDSHGCWVVSPAEAFGQGYICVARLHAYMRCGVIVFMVSSSARCHAPGSQMVCASTAVVAAVPPQATWPSSVGMFRPMGLNVFRITRVLSLVPFLSLSISHVSHPTRVFSIHLFMIASLLALWPALSQYLGCFVRKFWKDSRLGRQLYLWHRVAAVRLGRVVVRLGPAAVSLGLAAGSLGITSASLEIQEVSLGI